MLSGTPWVWMTADEVRQLSSNRRKAHGSEEIESAALPSILQHLSVVFCYKFGSTVLVTWSVLGMS